MDASQAVLEWDRGALEIECERSAVVRDGVEAYLGRKLFADAGDVTVRVSLSRVQEQGRARVEAKVSQRDAAGRTWGERSVSGDDSCASLDEQLTLVVALMVDTPTPPSEAEPEPAPLSPPPVSAPPPDIQVSTEINTAPSLERAAPSPAHATVIGFGAAALGASPEVAFGASLAANFKPRGFWGIGIEGAAFLPNRQSLDAGSLRVSLVVAGASLCPIQGLEGATWWSVCGSFQLARLHARSRGLLESRRVSQFFPLPGLTARAAHVFGDRWLLAGGLQVSFPVSPDRYVFRDADGDRHSAFEVSSFVLMASVGVGILIN